MGVVLSAEHLVLEQKVALKLLLPEAARIPGVVERFQREARAAMRVQSEHVARVMDVGVLDDGTAYLVMEHLEGRDLAQELEARGALPIDEAVNYVLQGAVGVAEAHALGIVHRDLKPSNLFLARMPNGRVLVKVLDFGIAKNTQEAESMKQLTSTFSALGSAAYMSPEQVRMAKSADVRTDVWALGVVLYELLTGRLPFEGESVTALAAAIIADAPHTVRQFRPEVPPALEAAVLACLEKDREKRTQSIAAFAQAIAPFGGSYAPVLTARIEQALVGAPSSLQSASSPSISGESATRIEISNEPSWSKTEAGATADPPPRRRSPVLLIGVITVLVAAAGILGWAFLLHRASTSAPGELGASTTATSPAATTPAAPPPVAPAATASTARSSRPMAPVASASAAPVAAQTTPSRATTESARPRRRESSPSHSSTSTETPPQQTSKKPLVTDL